MIISNFQTLIQYISGIQQSFSGAAVALKTIATKIANGINLRFPGVFTNTQMNPGLDVLVNGLDPTTFYHLTHPGNFVTSAVLGGIIVPSTSTVYEADAIVGYVSTASTATAGVGGSFYALNEAAGTVSYALNPLVSDQGFASTVVGAEFDVGCSNVLSSAFGINMIGVFTAGTPATAIAYQVSVLNSPWQYSLVSYDGCTANFALIGAIGTVANSDGQPIQLNARDATNTVRVAGIQARHAAAGCDLVFETPTGASFFTKPLITAAGAVGAGTFPPAGMLTNQTSVTGIGNGANTTDDTLFSYSLPASSFDQIGRGIVVEAYGLFGANGNDKQVKLFVNAFPWYISGVVTLSGAGWYLRALINMSAVNEVTGMAHGFSASSFLGGVGVGSLAITTAAPITITITGSSPTTGAANDVLGYGMTVEFRN